MDDGPQKFKYAKPEHSVQITDFIDFILALLSVAIFWVHFKLLCWHNKDDGTADNTGLTAFSTDYKLVEMYITLGQCGHLFLCFFFWLIRTECWSV